ncbi:MAG: hypothetical protein ABI679_14755 [Gemmatimonadota bacterium]
MSNVSQPNAALGLLLALASGCALARPNVVLPGTGVAGIPKAGSTVSPNPGSGRHTIAPPANHQAVTRFRLSHRTPSSCRAKQVP